MQQQRRHTPHPLTWEVPAGLCAAAALVAIFGVHLGRTAANLVTGHGWGWPAREELFASLPGLLTGDANAGLANPIGAGAAVVPLWTCIAIAELGVLIGLGWALKQGLDRWGPHRLKGMATRAQVEQTLGRTRLRKVAGVVRPDLHGKDKRR